jgi:hypothetical protein
MAHLSRYHVMGPIDLESGGEGGLYVGLSRSKCIAAGKDVSAATAKDADVARDFAVILVGGMVAEQVAAEFNAAIEPSRDGAALDHAFLMQALAAAGLSKKFDRYEEQARTRLRENWRKVEALAHVLLRDGACPTETAKEIFLA